MNALPEELASRIEEIRQEKKYQYRKPIEVREVTRNLAWDFDGDVLDPIKADLHRKVMDTLATLATIRGDAEILESTTPAYKVHDETPKSPLAKMLENWIAGIRDPFATAYYRPYEYNSESVRELISNLSKGW
jgi:hypothetical protein